MSAIDAVAKHPIPSRIADGPEVPYIGPHFEAYKKAHAETIGENSDKWWAKVSRCLQCGTRAVLNILTTDCPRDPPLGPPLHHCEVRLLRERRYLLVP